MDKRERAGERGDFFAAINEGTMRLLLVLENDEGEEVETWLPFKYEACDVCDGKGTHVNPSIDSHGLSREDFDADPDFEESYFRGDYDVTCYQCKGRRVYPVVEVERMSNEEQKLYEEHGECRSYNHSESGPLGDY
jgi:hypothetical protein